MIRDTEIEPLSGDPLWYKDAIIYELHVRAFYDSDADGVGDFPGLVQKLDYLKALGVNTLWLLPFYPSPLKDDGYDIADYYNVHPAYGTMADFEAFVREAHRRGLRIITELVINHTSDQHPWFQQARRSAPGSRRRDYYVWSDSPEKYKDVRIIFKDTEYSNWAWDPVAKAYYWHRFYSHQPDLNYDNPAVRRAIFRVVDFWLGRGVDGLRVDAVPYLYEREGTSCENLPETHAFLKELRAHIDRKFSNRMLLAEANQWPEDVVPYFGNGDESHMAFHFPIMPRLFMAISMEDRFPLIDILRQTPPIPESCQWAVFLRNHDELTLEMVTDEERDYMYRVYARDPVARLNLGIRRRLAPLLNNDRKKIELINALLFSLPGTPVIYYGDEIGMGDNFYLGDRNGMRTPMQWSPDRNGGFSRANPQQLYLPPIIDPGYHYEAVNVETQEKNPDSLLWWMRRIIATRKQYQAFGRGQLEILQPQNRKVLAFLRRYREETILVIANLSHLSQQVELALDEFTGQRPVDVFGPVEFAPITGGAYHFTLSPYAFYWFSLQPRDALRLRSLPAEEVGIAPTLTRDAGELFDRSNWASLEPVLQNYLKDRRWFRSKARNIRSPRIIDVIPMHSPQSRTYFVLFHVDYTEGEPETYAIPLSVAPAEQVRSLRTTQPQAIVARLQEPESGEENLLYDAMVDKAFLRFLVHSMSRSRHFKGENGEIVSSATHILRRALPLDEASLEPVPVTAEQTNTSVVYGRRFILKLFRTIEEGSNPELEMGRFLTQKTDFAHISHLAGALEYCRHRGKPMSLAVLQVFVPNEGDAWHHTLDSLERYLQNVLAHPAPEPPPIPQNYLFSLPAEPEPIARETIGAYLISAQLLGRRTAELHLALASIPDDPEFAPEPFTFTYQIALYQSMRSFTTRILQMLQEKLTELPAAVRADAQKVLDMERAITERYQLVRSYHVPAMRLRCHGDYHLGQVLHTGKDFVIIDFEGEPARPVSERRLKRCPLQDVAGMIRSFHYAAQYALLHHASLLPQPEAELPRLQRWIDYWYAQVAATFLRSYLAVIRQGRLLPETTEQIKLLLEAFMLEKAVYEIDYELNNRPDWVKVPIQGILQVLGTASPTSSLQGPFWGLK